MASNQPVYDPCLDKVAEAIAESKRELACIRIESYMQESEFAVEALLIHAWATSSLREAEASVEKALELNPSDEWAMAGLTWIRGIQELTENQLELKARAEEQARQEEEERRLEAEEQARQEEEERRLEAEEQARQEEEERRLEAEEQARQAEEERRLEAEEQARQEEEERRLEAEEQARQAEEERRFEEQARQAEEQTRQEEEERRLEAEEQARQAEEERRLEAEEQTRQEEEERRLEAEHQTLQNQQQTQGFAEDEEGLFGKSEEQEQFEELQTGLVDHGEQIVDEINTLSGEVQLPSAEDEDGESSNLETGPRKFVVLAVDDSPTVRKLVSMTLSREGFEVVEAENGVEALNILANRHPDIILSDINMPKLNGYKLCKFVKKHERTMDIPVVMLSGKDGVFDKMRGKLNGCDDFISKPFESAALVAKVKEHLASHTNA